MSKPNCYSYFSTKRFIFNYELDGLFRLVKLTIDFTFFAGYSSIFWGKKTQ